MNYTIIALVFIIIFMLYLGYTYFKNMGTITTVLSLGETDTDKTTINSAKISNPNSSTFHYEGWLYLNELPSNANNIICSRETNKDNKHTALVLKETTFSLATVTTTSAIGTATDANCTTILTITNDFPIQKWVYVVVNVFKNKQIEAYLNGKLVITSNMSSEIEPKLSGKVRLCNSTTLKGYITLFRYDSTALTPDAVWKKYLSGNGMMSLSNWLAGYNASFTISQNMEQLRKYTLL